MGSVSKERLFGATIKAAEQRAREARRIEQRMPLQAVLGERGFAYKRGHLVRLRRSKVTTKDDGEPWYPGDPRDRN